VNEHEARRTDSGGCGWLVLVVVLVSVGSWFVRTHVRFVVAGLAALLVALTVGFVVVLAWRLMLPARATRVLSMLGASKEEGGRFRLRRLSRRGRVWHVAWRVPVGVTVTGLQRQREAIEQALDAAVELWYDRGKLHMRAGTARLPAGLRFEQFHVRPGAGELPVAIGASRFGPLWADLAALPHLLVGGLTGGGKSAFLRQLLVGLVLRLPPERLRLVVLDLKGMEFGLLGRLPHLMAPVARDLDAALAVLGVVNGELDRRQDAFAGAGVETLGGWNEARPGEALPYVLVVVDECAELAAAEVADRDERARRQQALAHLSRLCRLGRASGVHVIVSTQRPDADAVPGQVKANIPATVAFRVRNATNSRILLGEGGESAAALPPWPGRGVWQWDTETQFQAPWLSVRTARALLDAAYPPVLAAGTDRVSPCPESPQQEAA
jgi:S-DNA-T family DNA segregation ATPase FtsK/SpoIIIE